MGSAWVCYGYAVLTSPAPTAQVVGLTIVTTYVPLHALAWIWVLSGLTGIGFCAVRHVGHDSLGFTALVMPAALWSAGYLLDWIVIGEYERGWVVASTYGAIAASIVITSGWPEPRRESGE